MNFLQLSSKHDVSIKSRSCKLGGANRAKIHVRGAFLRKLEKAVAVRNFLAGKALSQKGGVYKLSPD